MKTTGQYFVDILGFQVPKSVTHLKEPPQPPDLENRLANDDANDKQVPPLDAAVCALGGVAVGALADNDVALLVLNHLEQLGQLAHLDLERVLGGVRLGNVDDAVDVERHLLGRRAPVLVAEAVDVLAVVLGLEREVAVGYRLFENLVLPVGVGDL